jgi:hypothetical protein
VRVEVVPAGHSRGAIPTRGAVDADAQLRAARALDELARQRWGWGSKEWPDVTDAVAVVVEALDVDPNRRR